MCPFPPQSLKFNRGFTLAELLISLAILGVIATFTIPKILSSSQNGEKVAKAKEVAAMISGAYQQAQLAGVVNANTQPADLTPYMNYVAVDTSTALDDYVTVNVNYVCGSGITCLKTHSGGTLFYVDANSFTGTNPTNGILFFYDPDSQRTGISGDAPGKTLCFYLYYSGRLTTRGTITPGSVSSVGTQNPGAFDPSWFSWN